MSTVNDAGPRILSSEDLSYVGAFRVPPYFDSTDELSFGGGAMAYDSSDHSLFLTGHRQSICKISVPDNIVNSRELRDLSSSELIRNFRSIIPSFQRYIVDTWDGAPIGGMIVAGGRLIGTQYAYYSGANTQDISHWYLSSTDLETATVQGLYNVGGESSPGARYLSGWMCEIPSEWQSVLGASHLTGQAALSILSTTSAGPSAFGFDPEKIGLEGDQVVPYLYYPNQYSLGPYQGQVSPIMSGTTQIGGCVFPPGTGSVIFFGRTGTSFNGYGTNTEWNDPFDGGKGPHALNGEYKVQFWAYRASDFLDVKNGVKKPWEIYPYDVWNMNVPDLPYSDGEVWVLGVTFDPSTGRIYMTYLNIDHIVPYSSLPIVQVFQVSSEPKELSYPRIGAVAVTPTTVVPPSFDGSKFSVIPGPFPAGTPAYLTASNVYPHGPGRKIVEVHFYREMNGSGVFDMCSAKLLGMGVGRSGSSGPMIDCYDMVYDTTGLESGVHRISAIAIDSWGRMSNVANSTFQIS